jgi:signal transduction histidine kinase
MKLRAMNLVTLVALGLLISYCAFAWSRRVDERACAHYEQTLRSLLALDFRLSAEVMKAHAGVVAHYDGVVQTIAAGKRLQGELNVLPAGLWSERESEIRARLRSGSQQRRATSELVERFKREHAVLRNSLRFLPALLGELEQAEPQNYASEAHVRIDKLIRDELLLQSWQDSALIARIDRALSTPGESARPSHQADQAVDDEDLRTLLSHARVVRERTPVVQELTRKIVAGSDAHWTEGMLAAFRARQRRAQRTADFDAQVCFALALIFLAAAATSIILSQQRAAVALRSTSRELAQAVASLRLEQEKQKELAELKSRFVSMASHEFRTPLSVIVSSSELLEAYGERWPDAKKREHFTRIKQTAAGMTRMLDDILAIGRHDTGLLRFEPKPLAIAGFCAEVVEAMAAASGQGQRILYTGPSPRERVVADPVLLRHVLENLLSNALKYSPEGGPVDLTVVREEESLRLDVSDRGIGISEEDQQRLFETFHRGKNVGEIAGTGLGLAIVQGAVELHGGKVTVQSQLGVGTQFTVRIPVVRARAEGVGSAP